MGKEGTYLNTVKAIYDKPTPNIILSGEKLKHYQEKKKKDSFYCSVNYPVNCFLHPPIRPATWLVSGPKVSPGYRLGFLANCWERKPALGIGEPLEFT